MTQAGPPRNRGRPQKGVIMKKKELIERIAKEAALDAERREEPSLPDAVGLFMGNDTSPIGFARPLKSRLDPGRSVGKHR
jgi:hypothetical protein